MPYPAGIALAEAWAWMTKPVMSPQQDANC